MGGGGRRKYKGNRLGIGEGAGISHEGGVGWRGTAQEAFTCGDRSSADEHRQELQKYAQGF